ncbi:host cell division inhibitor Icd-like protein, partial [Klebsiella pneumoniae]|nr:host cell division inhibitor Icd-like protein [Klebsiella pneumoniae]
QTGVRTMFKFKFAAICRTDKKSHIHHLSTIASSEREARRQFASRFVLVLSARIRVSGVAA